MKNNAIIAVSNVVVFKLLYLSKPNFMDNKTPLSFCLFGYLLLCSFVLPEVSNIEGTWVLSRVQANGTIAVGNKQSAVGNASFTQDIDETTTVSLKEEVEQNLTIDRCKFIFKGDKYEFYRKGETLSHQGIWAIKGDSLLLNRAYVKEPLVNKIFSIDQQTLQLEIDYSGKPVTLIFTKK